LRPVPVSAHGHAISRRLALEPLAKIIAQVKLPRCLQLLHAVLRDGTEMRCRLIDEALRMDARASP